MGLHYQQQEHYSENTPIHTNICLHSFSVSEDAVKEPAPQLLITWVGEPQT